jgi:hypothetical protein
VDCGSSDDSAMSLIAELKRRKVFDAAAAH